MRTYSHAIFTWAVGRRAGQGSAAAVVGAVLPDLPAAIGVAWLFGRRRARLGREAFLEGYAPGPSSGAPTPPCTRCSRSGRRW